MSRLCRHPIRNEQIYLISELSNAYSLPISNIMLFYIHMEGQLAGEQVILRWFTYNKRDIQADIVVLFTNYT